MGSVQLKNQPTKQARCEKSRCLCYAVNDKLLALFRDAVYCPSCKWLHLHVDVCMHDTPVSKLQKTNGAPQMRCDVDSKIACYKLCNKTKQADSNILVASSSPVQEQGNTSTWRPKRAVLHEICHQAAAIPQLWQCVLHILAVLNASDNVRVILLHLSMTGYSYQEAVSTSRNYRNGIEWLGRYRSGNAIRIGILRNPNSNSPELANSNSPKFNLNRMWCPFCNTAIYQLTQPCIMLACLAQNGTMRHKMPLGPQQLLKSIQGRRGIAHWQVYPFWPRAKCNNARAGIFSCYLCLKQRAIYHKFSNIPLNLLSFFPLVNSPLQRKN